MPSSNPDDPCVPHVLSAGQIRRTAALALSLLGRHPIYWGALMIGFVVAIEIFRFIPYVGLPAKLSASSLLGAQMLVLFADCERGQPLRLRRLLGILRLPPAALAVIVYSVLQPFSIGLLWVFLHQGGAALASFFGRSASQLPTPDIFFEFKSVMLAAAMPFTFFGAAVTLKHLSGWRAMIAGWRAAWRNPACVILLVGLTLLAECVAKVLLMWVPGIAGILGEAVWVIGVLGFMMAWTYTQACAVLGVASAPASDTDPRTVINAL